MSALEWLDAVRADLDAATPGPWEAGSFPDAPWDPAHSFVEIGEHEVRLDWLDGSALDARLIASAPDRLDRMERALRKVLDPHRPIEVEPSDTICAACSNQLPNGRFLPVVEYPCPPVTAILEVLG